MPYDNQSELFYWVDENDQVLGSVSRQEAHSGSHKIHRALYVILLNSKQEILMQKRSPHKDLWPEWWSLSVGGHVTFGESYEAASLRETQEEIGLTVTLTFQGTFLSHEDRESEMLAVFTAHKDVATTDVQFDPTEVSEVRWIPRSELKTFIANNQVVPYVLPALKIVKLL